jgi:gas vesicle protein
MMTRDGAAGFGLGILMGVALGAAIGILYAPRTGRETRELIRERAQEAKTTIGERAKKVVADIKGKTAEAEEE